MILIVCCANLPVFSTPLADPATGTIRRVGSIATQFSIARTSVTRPAAIAIDVARALIIGEARPPTDGAIGDVIATQSVVGAPHALIIAKTVTMATCAAIRAFGRAADARVGRAVSMRGARSGGNIAARIQKFARGVKCA